MSWDWLEESKLDAIEYLRMFFGACLVIKGIYFFFEGIYIHEILNETFNNPYVAVLVAHTIVAGHITGGVCIIFGFFTRLFCLLNIPILIGAMYYIHVEEGFFTQTQGLELTIIVLVLLITYAWYGSGKISIDQYLKKKKD